MAYNSHGHTPAAWTTVIIVCVAFIVGGIAVMVQNWPLFWIGGVALTVAGGIIGKIMQMMGLGQVDTPQIGRSRASTPAGAPAEDTSG